MTNKIQFPQLLPENLKCIYDFLIHEEESNLKTISNLSLINKISCKIINDIFEGYCKNLKTEMSLNLTTYNMLGRIELQQVGSSSASLFNNLRNNLRKMFQHWNLEPPKTFLLTQGDVLTQKDIKERLEELSFYQYIADTWGTLIARGDEDHMVKIL
jgi:hypothetical protein